MEEALIDRPRVRWRDEPARWGAAATRPNDTILPADLPVAAPGELWLMECAVAARLSALERKALSSANVVIYDRELKDKVAAALPIGGYAEPSVGDNFGRCVQFVRDGWSVVRLVERAPPHADFADRACRLVARLRAAGVPPVLRASGWIRIDTLMFQRAEALFEDVDALIEDIRDGTGRTLVFSAFGPAIASCLYPVGSKGLAGDTPSSMQSLWLVCKNPRTG